MIVEQGVSGSDFVRAMIVAGFRLGDVITGYTCIQKGDLELVVPQLDLLPEEQILVLLERAHMQPVHFVVLVGHLEKVNDSDACPGFVACTRGRE
jgi:hypothetical protein